MTWHLEPTEGAQGLPEGIGEGARADMRLAMDALHEYMQEAERGTATVAAHFAAWEAEMQGPSDIGSLSQYGLFVEPSERGFELHYFEGPNDHYTLEIEGFGGAAPTPELAEAEGIRRIERGDIGRAA